MIRIVILLLTLSLAASAQYHTAGWSFIGDANAATLNPVAVGRISSGGKLTTILPFSKLVSYDPAHGGALDVDDSTYVVAILSKLNTGKLLRVDSRGTLLQTLQVLSAPPPAGGFVHDVIVDQNGDYITVVGPPTAAHQACLLKVNRAGAVSTVFRGAGMNYPSTVLTDIDTGNFLLLDKPNRAVFNITPDGATVTSVGIFTQARYIGDQMAQHIATGDLYAGSYSYYNAVLVRMDIHGVSTLFLASGLYGAYGMHMDRSSDPNPRLTIGSTSWDSGVFHLDLKTQVITTLISTNTGFPLVYHKVFPDREVATLRKAPGKWDVLLHLAGEGGSAYAVGLGLSGVRPGVALPDGRHLWFNPDALTPLSIDGRLGPLFTGYAGVLDPSGRATARLDVSMLPALKGLRIWIQAVTLAPAAPLGIRTIPDPVILLL